MPDIVLPPKRIVGVGAFGNTIATVPLFDGTSGLFEFIVMVAGPTVAEQVDEYGAVICVPLLLTEKDATVTPATFIAAKPGA